jgi:hypothetical protein
MLDLGHREGSTSLPRDKGQAMSTRRELLIGAAAAGIAGIGSPAIEAISASAQGAAPQAWDSGQLAHLLPTASHERLLLKASFLRSLEGVPVLEIAGRNRHRIRGHMTDTRGECWLFDARDLTPATTYRLRLRSAGARSLCEPWTLSTFPAPDAKPDKLRLLIYTCAGGHDALTPVNGKTRFLPTAGRQRLIRRGLSFQPDALVANGDHVYWDLAAPRGAPVLGTSAEAKAFAGEFDFKQPVLGTANETFLRRAAGPQIAPLYGTLCRSTPVFFIQDDHDHFDNDEATDEVVTFPPRHWMVDLAQTTQRFYYPEFLPDPNRPLGLPGSSALGRPPDVSEVFGTLRYGTLAEILLYSVRRTMTLAGPSAVFLDPHVEGWLAARMAAREVAHVVNVPSNPPGWSAGKWGEWYPDILGDDGKLTVAKAKPYWQPGWLKQHDRIVAAASAMPGRIPLIISGDLHAIGEGRIHRSGSLDFQANPVVAVLAGPISTGDLLWPSAFRGIGPAPATHIDMREDLAPIEENGFTIADFTRDSITLQYFRWNAPRDDVAAIDTLAPFRVSRFDRPS